MSRYRLSGVVFVFLTIISIALVPSARAGEAVTDRGAIAVTGAVQLLWENVQADPGRQVDGVSRFITRRSQVALTGAPSEQTGYHLAFEINGGNTVDMGVYEAWIEYRPHPDFNIMAGSIIPPWTLTMSEPVHSLDFIRYPLLVDSGQWLFTPWRQTGLMASYSPGDYLDISVGIWSGLDVAGAYMDDNNMKDTMVSAGVRLYPGLNLHLGYWGGKTDLRTEVVAVNETVEMPFGLTLTNDGTTAVEVGGGVIEHDSTWAALTYERGPLSFAGEAIWHRSTRGGSGFRDAQGYQVSLSYLIGDYRALVRYEQFDPDSEDQGPADFDELEYTTVGMNYEPAPWAKLMFNYVFTAERGENQRADDRMLLQFSLGF